MKKATGFENYTNHELLALFTSIHEAHLDKSKIITEFHRRGERVPVYDGYLNISQFVG